MVQQLVDLLASTVARIEESSFSAATILPNFPRSIQLDGNTCGEKCTYCILKYFRNEVSHQRLQELLQTDQSGTAKADIKRVLKQFGLRYRVVRNVGDLRNAVLRGFPVLVSTHYFWHYSVVYGVSRTHFLVMNPSLWSMGSLSVAVSRDQFLRQFDGWGLLVSSP
jgi:ABC-type bacteriocin/lantibiotic exporter with double-glycine peptidase domain